MYESHSFSIRVACLVGTDAAAVLQNIAWWVRKNEANNVNVHEGKAWTYNSVRALAELFPYLTARQMRTVMKKLKDEGLIEVGTFNRMSWDRTTWYTITPKARQMLGFDAPSTILTESNGAFDESVNSFCQNGQSHLTKMTNGSDQNVKPIPYINTNIKPVINTDKEEANASLFETNVSNALQANERAQENVPYHEIQNLFNGICGQKLKPITRLTDGRKKAIKARWNSEGKKIEVFETLFKKAAESTFLTGNNQRNFMATFDWLMKPENFVKTIEGNYDNKRGVKQNAGTQPINSATTGTSQTREQSIESNKRTLNEFMERLAAAKAKQAQ